MNTAARIFLGLVVFLKRQALLAGKANAHPRKHISLVLLAGVLVQSQVAHGLHIYALSERDSWLKRFRLDGDKLVEEVTTPVTGGTGLAVLPKTVVVAVSNSELVAFDRNLKLQKRKPVQGLGNQEVAMWSNGPRAFVLLHSGLLVVDQNLRKLIELPSARDLYFSGRNFTAVADQAVSCVPVNDIPCYVPFIYVGGIDRSGSPVIRRKLPLSSSRNSVVAPNARFFVHNARAIGIIIDGMVPGRGGAVAIQRTAVFDPKSGRILGDWRKSYQQARSGYGFGKSDQGTAIVATASHKGSWGIVRRASEFFLVDLSIENDQVVIGQRHNLYLGVGTYDGQGKPGRMSIGTLTPRIIIRGRGERLVLSIDHVLFVIDIARRPRVIARYISGKGYSAAISGLDVTD